MPWPPKPGELLPRAEEPLGVRRKLLGYSLNQSHVDGWSKARGFAVILGITMENVDYLEAEICLAILNTPMSSVRDNPPYGVNCVVEFPIRGLGGYERRLARLLTVWEFVDIESRPRLVNAIPRKGELK